jgi:proteasome lid subunit RPN8/RPN11
VTLRLQRAAVDEMDRQAVRAYPRECCGVILSVADSDEVRPITNVQDRLHAEDPIENPRDATIAYYMDPKELYAVLRESEDRGRPIRVFYHSHPDHGAYFSTEDEARAMAWDEPAYPDAYYLVLSVVDGAVKERLAVAWDPRARKFSPVDVSID